MRWTASEGFPFTYYLTRWLAFRGACNLECNNLLAWNIDVRRISARYIWRDARGRSLCAKHCLFSHKNRLYRRSFGTYLRVLSMVYFYIIVTIRSRHIGALISPISEYYTIIYGIIKERLILRPVKVNHKSIVAAPGWNYEILG